MSSAFDDDDLALSINPSHTRRGSARSPTEHPQQQDPMQNAASQRRPPEANSMPTGLQRMGQYHLIKTLGEGSFGKVKLAIHKVTKQQVALKIISRRKLMARDMVGRVEREIQYLQLLRHPHIIKLYTVITTEKDIIMVLEYAGSELFNYLVDNGKMAEDKARTFFQQIVCAVEYCHRHKIVHRDLKPENLLLDENLHVKIADFGLSNIMTDGNFLKTSCGSPNYAAPEVISGKLYAGPEVDVWSCGVILYVLLVGRLPFDDEYIPALFKKIAQGNYHIPQYISKGAASLIKKMLQTNPVQRITVQEIRQDEWFKKNLPDYLQPPVEEFLDTGVDPNKAIDPKSLAPTKPAEVIEKLHNSVVGKLGKTMGYGREDVQQALAVDEPNAIKDAYLIVRENQIMRETPSMAQDPKLKPFLAQSPTTTASPIANMAERMEKLEFSQSKSSEQPNHDRRSAHRLSSDANSKLQARSPGGTIAVLPSSLPDYHKAFMSGQPQPEEPENLDSDAHLAADPATRARRLNPHSKSQINLERMHRSEETTSATTEKPKKKAPKWQFGIRSRNPPAEAMLAIYRALKAMGAEWEVPTMRKPGDYGEENEQSQDSGSISGSSDEENGDNSTEGPGSGTASAPGSGTNSTQSSPRSGRRKKRRYDRWNDWGYKVPSDPWIINARFRKQDMFSTGVLHPSSANSSRIDLSDSNSPQRRRSSTRGSNFSPSGSDEAQRGSPASYPLEPTDSGTSSINPSAHASTHSLTQSLSPNSAPPSRPSTSMLGRSSLPDDSAYVYLTIQLYALGARDQEMYVVDFKCAGYERLIRKLVRVVGSEPGIDSMTDLDAARQQAGNADEQPVEDPLEGDEGAGAVGEHGASSSSPSPPNGLTKSGSGSGAVNLNEHEYFASGRPSEGGNWEALKRRRSQKKSAQKEQMGKSSSSAQGSGSSVSGHGSASVRATSGTESKDFAAPNLETPPPLEGSTSNPMDSRGGSRQGSIGDEVDGGGIGSGSGSGSGSRRFEESFEGEGRAVEEKEVSSPFPFLDVACRMIIQLAEAS